MTDVTKKYKERAPEETVALIRDFFRRAGFETECFAERSDVGTHFCKVNLYFRGELVLDTNGKGMTEAFSMASGYAELYERFCNQINYLHNPFWCDALMERSRKTRGYALAEGERVISDEEAVESPEYAPLFSQMFRTQDQRMRALRVMLGDSPVTEIPYTDVVTGEAVYMDPRLLLRMDRSKGCAAGNTAMEAFNQSMSELLENEAATATMMGEIQTFHRISDEYLQQFPALYRIIEQIRAQGNELYVLDFGYETGYPVLASVLIGRDTASVSVDFGAFPVFEIALERVLTELYQGRRTCRREGKRLMPWSERDKYLIAREGANNITGAPAYPEGMYLGPVVEDKPSGCFLDSSEEGNEAIFNYFRQLCIEKDLQVCWRETSMTPEVAAVRVFIRGCAAFRDKGGAYEHSGSAFVEHHLSRMEQYVGQCRALLGGEAEPVAFLEMCRRFAGIDGSYVGAILNGEYLDLRFTKVPILTFPIMDILEGRLPGGDGANAMGKRVHLLCAARNFSRERAEKLLELFGGELDLDRLGDRGYLFEDIVAASVLDSFGFMQALAAAWLAAGSEQHEVRE